MIQEDSKQKILEIAFGFNEITYTMEHNIKVSQQVYEIHNLLFLYLLAMTLILFILTIINHNEIKKIKKKIKKNKKTYFHV